MIICPFDGRKTKEENEMLALEDYDVKKVINGDKTQLIKVEFYVEGGCGNESHIIDRNTLGIFLQKQFKRNVFKFEVTDYATKDDLIRKLDGLKSDEKGWNDAIDAIVDYADFFYVYPTEAINGEYGDNGIPIIFVINKEKLQYSTDDDCYLTFKCLSDRLSVCTNEDLIEHLDYLKESYREKIPVHIRKVTRE